MTVVPKISYAVSHYGVHFLRANVQFSNIEKNMKSMKTDPSIIYMVTYRKQNVVKMRYKEGKVEFHILKGISLLGIMKKWWKVDGEVSGFEY